MRFMTISKKLMGEKDCKCLNQNRNELMQQWKQDDGVWMLDLWSKFWWKPWIMSIRLESSSVFIKNVWGLSATMEGKRYLLNARYHDRMNEWMDRNWTYTPNRFMNL